MARSAAAESLRSVIVDFEKAREKQDRRTGDLQEKQDQLPGQREKTQMAEKALKDWEETSPVAQLQKRSGEYAAKRETYQTLQGLQKAKNEAEKTWKTKKQQAEAAAQALESAAQAAQKALLTYNKADSEEKDLRNRYYSGIYGELAAQLEEDRPILPLRRERRAASAKRLWIWRKKPRRKRRRTGKSWRRPAPAPRRQRPGRMKNRHRAGTPIPLRRRR